MKPYYEHAGITIYHGDCREVLPEMESTDIVITDPQYNVGMKYLGDADNMTRQGYICWCRSWFAKLMELSERIVIFPGHRNLDVWWEIRKPSAIACWYKPGNPAHGGIFQFCEWEPILVWDEHCKAIGASDVFRATVTKQSDTGNHPCPKPISLMMSLVKRMTRQEHWILDPFCGTGTTLIAAKRQHREAVGIEIEEKYCEIAAKRLSQEVLNFEGELK